jgi:nitroreductase
MNVKESIEKRRAYRSLVPVQITDDLIYDLADSARLFCSCFNNQPWRYIFVYDSKILQNMHEALSKGNEWAQNGSMIIAVFSKPDLDCIIKDRQYYLFDTGMATAALILRATELGLVAHPIAGFSPNKVKEILKIPVEYNVITLIIIGKKSEKLNPLLSEKQRLVEPKRPERVTFDQFMYLNIYKE